MAKDSSKAGYPVHAIGQSHTARLIGGTSEVVAPAEVEAARTRKQRRDRTVISRSDAFKGKHD